MKNCIIVDNHLDSLHILSSYVDRHPNLQLTAAFSNSREAFDMIQIKQPDLILLDIQKPSSGGIRFIKALKNPPEFIFTSEIPENIHRAREVEPIDYLPKPLTYERFSAGIAKFIAAQKNRRLRDYTHFKVDGQIVKIAHHKIRYAQSIGDYIIIATTEEKIITHMTMTYLSEILPQSFFMRIHRSYLVGIQHIRAINAKEIILDNISLPIGNTYKKAAITISH